MPDSLTTAMEGKLRAVCAQVGVAHSLDPKIQRELYGHMEDKLLAYLNGEETVAEEDAFILVREHFGDPAIIKGLLQNVHPSEARAHFLRRMVAIVGAVAVVVFFAEKGASLGVKLTLPDTSSLTYSPAQMTWLFLFFISAGLIELAGQWMLLRHWQRRIDAGRTVWFYEWSPVRMGLVFAGGLVLLSISRSGSVEVDLGQISGMLQQGNRLNWILLGFVSTLALAMSFVWFWWCDRPPRIARSLRLCACSWIALNVFLDIARYGASHTYQALDATTGQWKRVSPGVDDVLHDVAVQFPADLIFVLLAVVVYQLLIRNRVKQVEVR